MSLILVGICLLAVIGAYFGNNPMHHGRWFLIRRFINWFPLGMSYAFLYMARYNLNVSKNALGALMSKEDFGMIFAAGTIVYAFSFLVNGPLVDKIGGKRGIIIVETHPIDHGLLGRITKNARLRVSRLPLSGHRPDLDMTKPKRRRCRPSLGILVETRSQAHAVGKLETERLHRAMNCRRELCPGLHNSTNRTQTGKNGHGGHCPLMRHFRLQSEEIGTNQLLVDEIHAGETLSILARKCKAGAVTLSSQETPTAYFPPKIRLVLCLPNSTLRTNFS